MNKGIIYGIATYTLWGILPIYWKLIQVVPSFEIVGHRMVWSFVFVFLVVVIRQEWSRFDVVRQRPKIVLVYLATAIVLTGNWMIYIWAVNKGFIVETSLGYFINPLVNVLLGVVFLREGLRPWQWVSVGMAAMGVLYLTISYGQLPWIALSLGFSFGFYGLIKKTAALDSIPSFTLETGFMLLPALGWLLYLELVGRGAFGHHSLFVTIMLAMAGVATGFPLLLFGAAARRIPLSMVGFLQYIAPTLQFLIGVLIYGEDFSQDRVIGFCIIWLALLIFTADGILHRRRTAPAVYTD